MYIDISLSHLIIFILLLTLAYLSLVSYEKTRINRELKDEKQFYKTTLEYLGYDTAEMLELRNTAIQNERSEIKTLLKK